MFDLFGDWIYMPDHAFRLDYDTAFARVMRDRVGDDGFDDMVVLRFSYDGRTVDRGYESTNRLDWTDPDPNDTLWYTA